MNKLLNKIIQISENGIPIFNLFNEAKWFIQRGRRGWSDRDVWSLDHYLSFILSTALLHFADITHGHPCRSYNPDLLPDPCKGCECELKWDKELRENAKKFHLLYEDNWETAEELKRLDAARKEALEWLAEWYGHLWD